MKISILLCCSFFVLAVNAVSFTDLVVEEWDLFKTQFSKAYSSEIEEKLRLKVFMDNKYKIARHNKRFRNGDVSYELEMNHFGDMLHHEVIETMSGYKHNLRMVPGEKSNAITFIAPFNVTVPDTVDWRTQGAVTEVKNQGECGSCWAFSSTGSLEGQHFRSTGKLVSLSEQNLIDCCEENDGCDGGLMDNAFSYVASSGGIDTEASYPYEASDHNYCRYNPTKSGATAKGYVHIPYTDEAKLKLAVATVGPVSAAVDATHESFVFYKGGIYYEKQCHFDTGDLNHAVLVVGYGTENGTDYWLVKNSVGKSWGLEGYIKMARNKNNNCGIASVAIYPVV